MLVFIAQGDEKMGKGRQVVKPIKKYTDIRRIKDAMLADRNYKVYTLFVLGINLGLRISDLLQLKWKDVLKNGKVVNRLVIREKKTGKLFEIGLDKSKAVRNAILLLRKNSTSNIYLFAAENDRYNNYEHPMSYVSAYKWLRYYIQERAGLDIPVGTHTLRKTFGYQAHLRGYSLYRIQRFLNHSSPAVTKHYIDIDQEEKDELYSSLEL